MMIRSNRVKDKVQNSSTTEATSTVIQLHLALAPNFELN
ncbi:unnamed protein product [Schistosoma mattheei]|uniref:Uncharacterized protein n=1 Tax=Schistosoma mattheei TaxID=31246 RepID=A0A183NW02_9TREM|nr:unnamed protein product [Schistosoma mattheei]